jgi:hypothetical protein
MYPPHIPQVQYDSHFCYNKLILPLIIPLLENDSEINLLDRIKQEYDIINNNLKEEKQTFDRVKTVDNSLKSGAQYVNDASKKLEEQHAIIEKCFKTISPIIPFISKVATPLLILSVFVSFFDNSLQRLEDQIKRIEEKLVKIIDVRSYQDNFLILIAKFHTIQELFKLINEDKNSDKSKNIIHSIVSNTMEIYYLILNNPIFLKFSFNFLHFFYIFILFYIDLLFFCKTQLQIDCYDKLYHNLEIDYEEIFKKFIEEAAKYRQNSIQLTYTWVNPHIKEIIQFWSFETKYLVSIRDTLSNRLITKEIITNLWGIGLRRFFNSIFYYTKQLVYRYVEDKLSESILTPIKEKFTKLNEEISKFNEEKLILLKEKEEEEQRRRISEEKIKELEIEEAVRRYLNEQNEQNKRLKKQLEEEINKKKLRKFFLITCVLLIAIIFSIFFCFNTK